MKSISLRYLPVLLCLGLAACASPRSTPVPLQLLQDRLFQPPTDTINPAQVFAVSDAMRHYLKTEISPQLQVKGAQQGLIDALNSKNQLKLEYDSARTRNAAEAFDARAGNCLSLVIMTAALAKEIGLSTHYQSVFVDETWSRSGGLHFTTGHVNLTVGRRVHDIKSRIDDNVMITIDFNPPLPNKSYHTWGISEQRVMAMFMNNRGAEALARGQVNDAYWWIREAIKQDPTFVTAYNTLGVVYRRNGSIAAAEQAFNHALVYEPDNTQIMSNLAMVLADEGRHDEANTLKEKFERRRPYPPFHFFALGVEAMEAANLVAARDLFRRELARDPYNHEFHFWLAKALIGLGDVAASKHHLGLATNYSPTRRDHEMYAAKLDRLNAVY